MSRVEGVLIFFLAIAICLTSILPVSVQFDPSARKLDVVKGSVVLELRWEGWEPGRSPLLLTTSAAQTAPKNSLSFIEESLRTLVTHP